jgi:hypothetical protein
MKYLFVFLMVVLSIISLYAVYIFNYYNVKILIQNRVNLSIAHAECKFEPCIAVSPSGITAKAKNFSVAIVGENGTASASYAGTAIVTRYGGKATTGEYGISSTRNSGTSITGYKGTASAGDNGTASAGFKGTAIVGYEGTASAGGYGIIQIRWYDGFRSRILIGYIGEDGLLPNIKYKVEDGKFVEAE